MIRFPDGRPANRRFLEAKNTTCILAGTGELSGMDPFLHKISSPVTGTSSHAHLLVAESGGLIAMESPEAVMEEVEFRATHVSSLLEESKKHENFWEPDEP
jgi:hypothetical protein